MKIGILSANPKLYSTRRLLEAAKDRGHHARIIDHRKVFLYIGKSSTEISYHGERLDNYDAIIPRIGASVTFFGAAVVRQFESVKVFSINESQAIVRSRDKLRSTQLLAKRGIDVPKTAFAKFPKDEEVMHLVKAVGGAPVIIKLLEGTQGLGVVLAETSKAAKSVIEAFSGLQANILVQEFIKEAGGADIRVFVVGDEVVGAMKRQGKEGEFRSNLHRGGTSTAIKLKPRERSAAVKAAKALGLRLAGVDMLQSKRGPLILEVNSSPGLEGIEKATGIDIAGKIISYIEANAKKRGATADKIKI